MGKAKQQVLSRFFSAAPKPADPPPSPKLSTTVPFSPSKRRALSSLLSPTPKKPSPDPSLHRRFLSKLLEPTPAAAGEQTRPPPAKYTPLEQQVVELKAKHPDVLLMVEVGYKFRFFGDDAEVAAKLLGIVAHRDHSFMTASVPSFRLDFHVRRLVAAGCKVGVVRQTETAAIKAAAHGAGPFARGLSALYTKATLEAAAGLEGGEGGGGGGGGGNYLVCVVDREVGGGGVEVEAKVGLVGVEVSTGDVVYGEFEDDALRSGLESVVLSLSPVEMLLGEPLTKQTRKVCSLL